MLVTYIFLDIGFTLIPYGTVILFIVLITLFEIPSIIDIEFESIFVT